MAQRHICFGIFTNQTVISRFFFCNAITALKLPRYTFPAASKQISCHVRGSTVISMCFRSASTREPREGSPVVFTLEWLPSSRSHLLLDVSAMESTEIHKGTEIFTDTFKAETPYAHCFVCVCLRTVRQFDLCFSNFEIFQLAEGIE